MATSPPVDDALAEFLESGLAIVVATRDAELWPAGAWGWAVRVDDDREHLTLFLPDAAARAMLANLEVCPEIAIALDRPSTHRACQVKGRYVSSRKARAAERRAVEGQLESLIADLGLIGIPPTMFEEWRPWPCTALQIRVTELFEQTPGPGTGGPLR